MEGVVEFKQETHPLRRYSPVELQDRDMIQAEWPVRLATCSPEEVSYSTMTLESPAAARNFPPGENVTARTGFTSPIFGVKHTFTIDKETGKEILPERLNGMRPDSVLKICTLPFSCPLAIKRPSKD